MKRGTNHRGLVERLARDCLGVRLRLIHRGVSGIYDEGLRPLGVRVGQMNILIGVAYAGPVKPARLCHVLSMEKSTLSRDVDVLQRKGWVVVEPDSEERGQTLRLSPAGAALLEAALPAWEEAQRKASELLGPAGVDVVHKTAQKLGFPV
jgi:DNA-binding MarR family transcriptional regulator